MNTSHIPAALNRLPWLSRGPVIAPMASRFVRTSHINADDDLATRKVSYATDTTYDFGDELFEI